MLLKTSSTVTTKKSAHAWQEQETFGEIRTERTDQYNCVEIRHSWIGDLNDVL